MAAAPDRVLQLQTACALGAALVVGGLLRQRTGLVVAAAALLLACAASRRVAGWIAGPMLWLARPLGHLNAWIFLGAAFLLVLTPLALLRRLVGQSPAAFRPGPPRWVVREHRWGPSDLEHPW
jgi:hypothetical protein